MTDVHILAIDLAEGDLPDGVSLAFKRKQCGKRLGANGLRQGDRLTIMRQGLHCSRTSKPVPALEQAKLSEPMWTSFLELHTGTWQNRATASGLTHER